MLAFAGDVIAQDAVKAAGAAHGWSSVLGAAADAVRGADLALVNVESPITERVVRSGDMIFHADESLLAALRAAGFDVASFANNHVYDQGRRGFTDSLAALERAGFVVAGAGPSLEAACRPQLVERRGIRVALLARTLVLNFDDHATDRDPSVCRLAEGPLKRRAREAREAGADLVVASLHWGNEYEHSPRDEQVDAAQRIVEAGVDLVIGHHPHVLQRVARVHVRDDRDALVAYSLGNLVSNQARDFDDGRSPAASGDARDGVVLRVAVHRRADGRVAIDRAVAIPLWTAHGDDGGGDGDGIAVVPAPPARARRVAAALGHDVATLDLARATCP